MWGYFVIGWLAGVLTVLIPIVVMAVRFNG